MFFINFLFFLFPKLFKLFFKVENDDGCMVECEWFRELKEKGGWWRGDILGFSEFSFYIRDYVGVSSFFFNWEQLRV